MEHKKIYKQKKPHRGLMAIVSEPSLRNISIKNNNNNRTN